MGLSQTIISAGQSVHPTTRSLADVEDPGVHGRPTLQGRLHDVRQRLPKAPVQNRHAARPGQRLEEEGVSELGLVRVKRLVITDEVLTKVVHVAAGLDDHSTAALQRHLDVRLLRRSERGRPPEDRGPHELTDVVAIEHLLTVAGVIDQRVGVLEDRLLGWLREVRHPRASLP